MDKDGIGFSGAALILGSLLLSSGCVQTRITEPKRTAVEQLLISTAADQAIKDIPVIIFRDKKTYVDASFLESEDKGYVIGSIRDLISINGGLLVSDATQADIIVEPRSGALSIDSTESIIGLPQTPVPIPLAGTFQTPEIYAFKTQKQFSTAKLALLAYERESRKHLLSTGPVIGRAHHHYYKFLGYIKYTSTSIPEKKRRKK